MKELYIEIIDKALGAYSQERISDYILEVKQKGITEHGFPRLTANIGILIAHSRRLELKEIFIEMMEICCREIPTKKANNDFSVKEICFCILELKQNPVDGIETEIIEKWIYMLSKIIPQEHYTVVAEKLGDIKGNWAAFAAASEYMRMLLCGVDSSEFLKLQLSSQMPSFDINGMYKDPGNPIVYDYTTRNQLALPLYFGYTGDYADEIDQNIRKAGDLSLKMQSVTGEMPYGGRSNQFLHNETTIAITYELEACRYAKEGNLERAGEFKAAAILAAKCALNWLNTNTISHIKNCYPVDSMIGCEKYGYFNKYMITLASMAYMAYVFADDSINPTTAPAEKGGYIAVTSDDFHKIFLTNSGYHLQFDTNADFHYDANGLGRIHKTGARSQVCLTLPFAKSPEYKIEQDNLRNMSICVFAERDGEYYYGSEEYARYEITAIDESADKVSLALSCRMGDDCRIESLYTVTENGVDINVNGKGKIGICLPAFEFDGKNTANINAKSGCVTVNYLDSVCKYTFDGNIDKEYECFYNRSGKYRVYKVYSENTLKVHIEIN